MTRGCLIPEIGILGQTSREGGPPPGGTGMTTATSAAAAPLPPATAPRILAATDRRDRRPLLPTAAGAPAAGI
eukprot:7007632-Pyramimonas_sp.AAC.1